MILTTVDNKKIYLKDVDMIMICRKSQVNIDCIKGLLKQELNLIVEWN